jgi:hypothetical protein
MPIKMWWRRANEGAEKVKEENDGRDQNVYDVEKAIVVGGSKCADMTVKNAEQF